MTHIVLPSNYRFAGVHCGIRPDPQRLDLALVISDLPASVAGVFTQNRVCAAPVQVCRQRLPAKNARGVVICSGNANACTGQQGLDDARRMTALAAESIDCRPEQMLVASTGVIGRLLPMDKIEPGIRNAAKHLAADAAAFDRTAHAILTTDTTIKVCSRSLTLPGGEVRIAGFAKGAAMIGPNMATLLAFVLTDAAVAPDALQAIAARAADSSFNCISVEGHTSTNDTLLLFANGQGTPLTADALTRFEAVVTEVCGELARAIAVDAEGASHLVRIDVTGMRSDAEARKVAKTIADSALVKTALFGADPNWGRIVSAAGYAGVQFEESDLSLWLGDTCLYQAGAPLPFDAKTLSAFMKQNRELHLRLQFTLGSGRCTFWTCDLTYDYVRLNADYTT
ncbi:MAG TPA: bifunctional glutamate N-acetyltransferase/amino-acid acetyltransferase ArgJ [Gemmataceae bacterium]|nr:bifunctional glutamate N-acetyltransferase/amino-acid acetyltransferase ArgJ [Gemmataceae bacterium]